MCGSERHSNLKSVKYIAVILCISESTVRRTIQKFETTGDVAKDEYPLEACFRKITEPVQSYIMDLVLEKPGIYLSEIANELEVVFGVDITESALCKFLKKAGFSRQTLCTYASQRDEDTRKRFVRDVSLYQQETLVFIDETGSDSRDGVRKHGYSP